MEVGDLKTPQELATQLQISLATVYGWRSRGKGPRAYRVGRHLRFRQRDIDAWLERQADRNSA